MEAEKAMAPTSPTPAERVRTACARARDALVVTDGVPPVTCPLQRVLSDGTIALIVPRQSPIATMPANTPAVIEMLDRAPIPDSVRALVWICGRIASTPSDRVLPVLDLIAADNPDPALLDVGRDSTLLLLTVDSIVLADTAGAEAVDLPAFTNAAPDPFCRVEGAWVHHLNSHHPDMIHRLRRHLPPCLRRGRLQLAGVDRYGLVMRVVGPQEHWEVRIPFLAPVNDDAGLSRALRSLVQCPFYNGPRTRTNQPNV